MALCKISYPDYKGLSWKKCNTGTSQRNKACENCEEIFSSEPTSGGPPYKVLKQWIKIDIFE